MKDIIQMVEKFNVKRLRETIYGYRPHNAIIGEWVRWWLRDSRLGEKRKRRIIDPAVGITYRKKRAHADLLFAEQARKDSEFFKILGVAEIENNSSKFLKKLRNLSFYEQTNKDREDRKFPDLKFSVLCCRIRKPVNRENVKDVDLVEKLVKESKMYSRKSEIYWILYLLEYTRADEDYSFRVRDYAKGYPRFWYNSSFFGSEFYIHKDGKLLESSPFDH